MQYLLLKLRLFPLRSAPSPSTSVLLRRHLNFCPLTSIFIPPFETCQTGSKTRLIICVSTCVTKFLLFRVLELIRWLFPTSNLCLPFTHTYRADAPLCYPRTWFACYASRLNHSFGSILLQDSTLLCRNISTRGCTPHSHLLLPIAKEQTFNTHVQCLVASSLFTTSLPTRCFEEGVKSCLQWLELQRRPQNRQLRLRNKPKGKQKPTSPASRGKPTHLLFLSTCLPSFAFHPLPRHFSYRSPLLYSLLFHLQPC